MFESVKRLDELLRGRLTSPERLSEGELDLPLRRFVPLAAALGGLYGFFMGWFAVSRAWSGGQFDPEALLQILASTVKLPALFLLTLVVTFPSLYVFNALVGCRLNFVATLRLLVGAVVVNVAVAASFGPILGFFTLSTTSYPFMVLLNVILLGVAGLVAMGFLLHTLRRFAYPVPPPVPMPSEHPPSEANAEGWRSPGPLERLPMVVPERALGQARTIFQTWLIIYALVGAQMGWLLRPFIGSPDMPFEWFRPRSGNFFQAVIGTIQQLVGIR